MNYICTKQGKIDKLWGRFIKHILEFQEAGIKVEYIRKGEVVLNGKRYAPLYTEKMCSYEPIGWKYSDKYIVLTGYDVTPLIKYLKSQESTG